MSNKLDTLSLQEFGQELNGNWDVTWSGGDKARYSITAKDLTVKILSCDWDSCDEIKQSKFSPSTSNKYPSGDGWVEIDKLHDETLKLFIRKEKEKLSLIWYRSKDGYEDTGQGIKGEEGKSESNYLPPIICPIYHFVPNMIYLV